ncbi:MAG: 50S ribosomal protein L18 [Oscillospiraceae bacterium]|nr:50S ribosomal protein L18 [Oscillospiraceae bacterium]
MVSKINKNNSRLKRHIRVRSKVSGTAERPRLSVYRSENHIIVQIIDDATGNTLVSASSHEKDFAANGGNKAGARLVGQIIGKRALEKGISSVIFDRGGYLYHGRIQELAEGARESGLKF